MPRLVNRNLPGMTLLELMLATALTAAALVPALNLIRKGMKISSELETRQLTATYCVSTLEKQLCLAAVNWTSATSTGNFSSDGYSSLRYQIVTSDAALDGGITNRLMSVSVVVWQDTDGDTVLDTDEIRTSMRSKIAKMQNYLNEITP